MSGQRSPLSPLTPAAGESTPGSFDSIFEKRVRVMPAAATHTLAVGGELKNTVCLLHEGAGWLSRSHADLSVAGDYLEFRHTVDAIRDACPGPIKAVGHDLHPLYASTRFAQILGVPRVAIQHHHAHAVSCAVDAGLPLPVVAIVCDGSGFGTDGRSWGGEVLICDATTFRRVAHLEYFALPGGDVAARSTWRPGIALLREALQSTWRDCGLPALQNVNSTELSIASRQIDTALNAPQSSSLGRLFDAVAFLTGLCSTNEHEGQAASLLQAAATRDHGENTAAEPYDFEFSLHDRSPTRIDWRPMIRQIVRDATSGHEASTISERFHATVVAMFATAAMQAVVASDIDRVVLSGGCFYNDLVRTGLQAAMEAEGVRVGVHHQLSCGDAGLSLGQAVIASATARNKGSSTSRG